MLKSFLSAAAMLATVAPALANNSPDAPVLKPWKYELPQAPATVTDPGQPAPIARPVKKAEIVKPPSGACGEVGRWKVFFPTDSCSGLKALALYRY